MKSLMVFSFVFFLMDAQLFACCCPQKIQEPSNLIRNLESVRAAAQDANADDWKVAVEGALSAVNSTREFGSMIRSLIEANEDQRKITWCPDFDFEAPCSPGNYSFDSCDCDSYNYSGSVKNPCGTSRSCYAHVLCGESYGRLGDKSEALVKTVAVILGLPTEIIYYVLFVPSKAAYYGCEAKVCPCCVASCENTVTAVQKIGAYLGNCIAYCGQRSCNLIRCESLDYNPRRKFLLTVKRMIEVLQSSPERVCNPPGGPGVGGELEGPGAQDMD